MEKVVDENVNSVSDISSEELSVLRVAAELFSQPSNLRELTDGAEDWQIAKAERLIHQLLCDVKPAAKKGESI